MPYSKVFTPEQFDQALDAWRWIGWEGRTPWFASLFGDVFFGSTDGCWFLDTIEGTFTKPWATEAELRADLATPEGIDRYLLGGLAARAEQEGVILEPDQVFSFMPPPVLGGPIAFDNMVVYDFVVAVHLAGQLHEQIRDMPEGSVISGFKLDES